MSNNVEQILSLLNGCTNEQRKRIFQHLRAEFPIHPLEVRLNTEAEIILEAISRDTQGLTFRMIRGVIAEAAFDIEVVSKLVDWQDITPEGDLPYDFLLDDGFGSVSVQVKLQRSKNGRPMLASEGYTKLPTNMYVVETQRTRGGKDQVTLEDTRPYKFGEFDIIAVSMNPSTGHWHSFLYTVASWLLPQPDDESKLLKFQPVARQPNEDWTDEFMQAVRWLRNGIKKRIKS
ncbi:MAG: hypothetical protein H0T73_17925 [Ardenticatenales bacterium]|nr:hypothetical protein [Ardenticatenales bacterium]